MSTAEAGRTNEIPPKSYGVDAGRIRRLLTPEGVDLRVRLAEASERFTALVLDVAIMGGILVVMTLLLVLLALLIRRGEEAQFIAVVWLLGSFFLRNFYFMAFELTPRCATPGKRALGLRVVSRNGGALAFDAIFARNALRELELFLPLSFVAAYGRDIGAWGVLAGLIWCALFAFFPLFNADRLRVGDLVAGTWVIRAPKQVLEADLLQTRAEQDFYGFTLTEIEVYGVKELSVLEEVIRRRDEETVKAVAARIRGKIGRSKSASESDLQFLEAYYLALRRRLETRLLFGHRKRDKFDRA